MKKLLLALTTIFSVSAFAQESITITLDSPVTNQIVHQNESFEVKVTITNTGTDTILSTDTIYAGITVAGQSIVAFTPVNHGDLPGSSSFSVSLIVSAPSYYNDTTIAVCATAALYSADSGIVSDCHNINYRMPVASSVKSMAITLDSPVTGQTIHKDEPFALMATITNTGTDTIRSTDSIYFFITIAGQIVYEDLFDHNDIPVDSSFSMSLSAPSTPLYNTDTTLEICVITLFTLTNDTNSGLTGDCATISYVNSTVGVKELAAAKSLQVFPNPAVDVLNITFSYAETTQLSILDITGRTVKTMPIEAGSAKVDVSDMAKGIYLYSITTQSGQSIKSGKFSVSR